MIFESRIVKFYASISERMLINIKINIKIVKL